MLVVMENWNGHYLLELLLNVEAVWALDVFEVDATEGGCEILDCVN